MSLIKLQERAGAIRNLTKRINGGYNGLDHRIEQINTLNTNCN